MQRIKRVALVTQQVYFAEFAQACSKYLNRNGFEVTERSEIPEEKGWDAVLVVGIHQYTRLPFLPGTAFLGVQTEQLPIGLSRDRRLNRNRKRFLAVRDYYQLIFEWNPCLADAGVGGNVFLPYGCVAKRPAEQPKQWDAVFIGNVMESTRRREILDFLKGKFTIYPDFSPGFGDRKQDAIAGSKVCLNIY